MSAVHAVVAERPRAVPMQSSAELAMDCKVKKIMYGSFLAVRDSHVPIQKGKITGFIGPRLRQEYGATQPEPHERPD